MPNSTIPPKAGLPPLPESSLKSPKSHAKPPQKALPGGKPKPVRVKPLPLPGKSRGR